VFVTHGGLLSITEAICHNVVLVGSPFSGDQFANVAIVVQNKIGLQLDFNGMTEESLRKTLEEAMNDEDLQNNMEMKHKFLKDQKEKVIFRIRWTLKG
jgi:glucuronosyltransferase